MELMYEDSLKKALTELGQIEEELTQKEIRKEELRQNIRQWLEVNNLSEHESFDEQNKKYWRMQIYTSSRRNLDKAGLAKDVGQDVIDKHTNVTELSGFKCQTVKTKKKSSKAPAAPSGTK